LTHHHGLRIPLGEQSLLLFEDWLPADRAARLHDQLQRQLPWRQARIRLYGREVPIPRLQCWIGDPGMRYRYSGLTLEPASWPSHLAEIRDRLREETGHRFNSVLCNWYRNGADSMGWHSDDEPELGPAPVVASLTLGQARRFQFRRRGEHRVNTTLELSHNSLLLMEAGVQAHWQHQLPKSGKPLGARINLTFRQLLHPSPGTS
jgi:alkylated DNA repair dioxygenase AlkB